MLLAAIDPYDYDDGLISIKRIRHERWKMAWGFSEGIVSAIRRGVLTPVVCMGEITSFNSYDNEYYINNETIKPTDRTKDISKSKTIITRDSLYAWVEAENVDFVRKPPATKLKNVSEWSGELPSTEYFVDSTSDPAIEEKLLLPRFEHQSEGLEYIEEAVRQFWSTYDPDDKSTAPSREDVRGYLISKGAGVNLAKAVDEVLRPFELKKGGRKPLK
ncbi:hypothetical protein SPM24T3_19353 [Serratia sp. M24T3]|nr:hypothetical protein SPM24T3_19353 [Serratia sp. M24T3]